jgi:phage gpG-like protein
MGQILVDDAKKRIESTKRDPDGSPWAPWSIATEMGRMHDGTYSTGLLWRTGDLLSSIDYSVSGDNVFVGSPLNYAGFVQDGTGNMPAREFLGMSDEAHTQIMKATEQFLQDAI